MTNISTANSELPPKQRAIQDKCFHPTGRFVEFPKEDVEISIPARFEKIVRMYPDRIAIKMGDRALAYDELNRIANRIAHSILKKHVPDKELIALLFEDSIDGIAAILGALKAGKFYVALDPSWPPKKMTYVLEDSSVALILTNDHHFERAQRLSNNNRPSLNTAAIDDSVSSENLRVTILPDDKTSIIYTSGSTGEPKGVVETNRGRLHNIMALTNEAHICSDDKLSLIHSIHFATGRAQLFISLLNGASLFPFDIKSVGIDRMAQWIRNEEITILHLPPAVFRQLAASYSSREMLRSVRIIHLSGAPISQADFDLYKHKFSDGTYFAFHMGSTEAYAICSAVVDRTFSFPKEGTLAGYPIPDKGVLILDDNGRDAAPGEVGEIAVKSRYLAAGYWGQPELTKTKFLLDPAGSNENVYLTGDLGRKLPDGFIIHLGRKDFQVKIRGFRIEVTEVETALLEHPNVKESTVVAQESRFGDKRLVAYLVPSKKPGPSISELRGLLKEKLPDYMIPSAFVLLNALPLTPAGKIDRKALPLPSSARPELDTSFVAPTTPVEKELAQIWADVLSIDQVGIQDNFFDLGGHSLLATQVISRVINKFRVELPLISLFQSPTVADMTVVITENMARKAGDKELARMLAELESISDEEARKRLADEEAKEDSEK